MIEFIYEDDFRLSDEGAYIRWITEVIEKAGAEAGDITYTFANDRYVHKINVEYLNHDTLTDIISFDDTIGGIVSGDIFISVERVRDNAGDFGVSFADELDRVIIHGILHYLGLKDKTDEESRAMRAAEDDCLRLRSEFFKS